MSSKKIRTTAADAMPGLPTLTVSSTSAAKGALKRRPPYNNETNQYGDPQPQRQAVDKHKTSPISRAKLHDFPPQRNLPADGDQINNAQKVLEEAQFRRLAGRSTAVKTDLAIAHASAATLLSLFA
jgi:hypothetical protein